jgi:hypothetical protein
MHAVSAIPTRATRAPCPPRRRGLGALARQAAVDLTPQAVEQVAGRVVQLLHRQQQQQLHRQQAQTGEPVGMVTVAEFATYYKLNPAWVYEHADELGATRIGSGPKARIRLDFQTAKAALREIHAGRELAPADAKSLRSPRQPRSPRAPEKDLYSPDAPPLQSRPRRILGARASLARRPVGMRCI